MNLRSLSAELKRNEANLEFARRTINLLRKENPVNQKLLNEAVGLKRSIEETIKLLEKDIKRLTKNAKKKN